MIKQTKTLPANYLLNCSKPTIFLYLSSYQITPICGLNCDYSNSDHVSKFNLYLQKTNIEKLAFYIYHYFIPHSCLIQKTLPLDLFVSEKNKKD